MSVHFRVETVSTLPPHELFRRSLSVDAHVASMAGSGERAVGGVLSGQIGEGQTVTWQARHFGVRIRMTSLVSEVEEPVRFVDHQVRGPFKAFRHVHTFEPHDSGTLMVDAISFTAPFGPLGRLVERLVLGAYMHRLIVQRNEYLCHD